LIAAMNARTTFSGLGVSGAGGWLAGTLDDGAGAGGLDVEEGGGLAVRGVRDDLEPGGADERELTRRPDAGA
jgi:hypothetical protein